MKDETAIDQDSPTSRRMKARIIGATVEVVAQHGLSATTLARVADYAGVSQGVLVFHFKSKSGLFNATCRQLVQDYMAVWQPVLEEPDPVRRVVGLVKADFDISICGPTQLALWFAFWGDGGASQWYDEDCRNADVSRDQAMLAACRALTADDPANNPELLAVAIDRFTDGLWLQMHLRRGELSRDQALDMALRHLGLLVPESRRWGHA